MNTPDIVCHHPDLAPLLKDPLDAARVEARELCRLMGDAGLYAPIGSRDLRAACLAREAIASASPLRMR